MGNLCLLLAMASLLVACAGSPGGAVKEEEVESQVRSPAREDSEGIQVYPLKNPAVAELTDQASRAEAAGDLPKAASLLERALQIQPRDPELLQQMAEVQLQKGDYQQALGFAVRSYDIGPRVGEICSRNWRTIAIARDRLGDQKAAGDARVRAEQCMVTRPQGL